MLACAWFFLHPIIFDFLLFISFEKLIIEIAYALDGIILLQRGVFFSFSQFLMGTNGPEPMLENFRAHQMIPGHISAFGLCFLGRVGGVLPGLQPLMCIGIQS